MCEGYERFPVFLNRTARGLERNERLAEARPVTLYYDEYSGMVAITTPPAVPASPPAHEALQAQLAARFWADYTTETSKGTVWFEAVMGIAQPQAVLAAAKLALTLGRVGWLHGDERLVRLGRARYSCALGLMQAALYDEELRYSDQTLAAGRMLGLYEVSSVCGRVRGMAAADGPGPADVPVDVEHNRGVEEPHCGFDGTHESERTGRAQLGACETYPARYAGVTGMYATNGSSCARGANRDGQMILSFMTRRPSVFGNMEWTMKPWPDGDKPLEQRIYDQGFAIVPVIMECEKLVQMPVAELGCQSERVLQILRMCGKLASKLADLRAQFALEHGWDERWDGSATGPVASALATDAATTSSLVMNSFTRSTLMNLWALQLALGLNLNPLVARTAELAAGMRNDATKLELEDLATYLGLVLGQAKLLQATLNIVSVARECMQDGVGIIGPMGVIFPLTCGLYFSQGHQLEATTGCLALHRRLSQERGIIFARDVAREMPAKVRYLKSV